MIQKRIEEMMKDALLDMKFLEQQGCTDTLEYHCAVLEADWHAFWLSAVKRVKKLLKI